MTHSQKRPTQTCRSFFRSLAFSHFFAKPLDISAKCHLLRSCLRRLKRSRRPAGIDGITARFPGLTQAFLSPFDLAAAETELAQIRADGCSCRNGLIGFNEALSSSSFRFFRPYAYRKPGRNFCRLSCSVIVSKPASAGTSITVGLSRSSTITMWISLS